MNRKDLPTPNAIIDLKGLSCPGPIVTAKRMVDDLAEGEVLLLVSDCPGTEADLFAWARVTGNQVVTSEKRADGGHGYYIRKGRSSRPEAHAVLDVRGAVCPGPIVEAHKLLHGMREGEVLCLVSDCPGVERDISSWTTSTGVELVFSAEINPGEFEFFIRKNA
ncbi:MAG TPA: sulfurtransferase TusA family protein [Rhodocyclaceae bacterium]|nr:sulfurtransferase TusA family protein [Rhodocyclaceae bacterium]HRQ45391.1 sulfurtransferase TusA family protein [Rhodocyclaceae bacterium]